MGSHLSLLITLGALLMLSPSVKHFMSKVGAPSLVGFIGLGFAVSLLDYWSGFIDAAFDDTFAVLAQLGVVALLFRVGLTSDTRGLMAKLPAASLLLVGDVVTNLALGFVVPFYLLSLPMATSLVIATGFSATSVAVSVAVWEETGKLRSTNGQLLIDVAELDDLSGVILLAVLLAVIPGLQSGGADLWPSMGTTTLVVLLKLTLFIGGCYLFAHLVEPMYTRVNRRWAQSVTGLTISVLGAGLAIAAMAELLGFSLAIGAMFAGLAFSRDPGVVRTDHRFAYFHEFFAPFFFIHLGMQFDPAVAGQSLWLAAVLLVPAVIGKVAGVALPALRLMHRHDALLLGVSMVARAEITMIVVHQASQFGPDVVPDSVFGAMLIISVLTSIIAPLMLRKLLVGRG